VAKLADLPDSLISRADVILHELHNGKAFDNGFSGAVSLRKTNIGDNICASACDNICDNTGDNIFKQNCDLERKIKDLNDKLESKERVIANLKNIDFDELSPKKAFDLLWDIKKLLLSSNNLEQ
jgi:hypothetical protein